MKQGKSVILLSICLLLFGCSKNSSVVRTENSNVIQTKNRDEIGIKNKPIIVYCNKGDQLASIISGVDNKNPSVSVVNEKSNELSLQEVGKINNIIIKGELSKTRVLVVGDCKEKRSVIISQDNIVIDGLGGTITGNGTNAIFIVKGKGIVIKNFGNIRNGGNGIVIDKHGSLRLENVSISKNKGVGLLVGNEKEARVFLKRLDALQRKKRRKVGKIIEPLLLNSRAMVRSTSSFGESQCDFDKPTVSSETLSFDAQLCDVNIHENEYAVLLGHPLFSADINPQDTGKIVGVGKGCSVIISNHSIGGLGAFSGSTFCVKEASLAITNNQGIGAIAVDNSALLFEPHVPIDSNFPTILSISGHTYNLCNKMQSYLMGNTHEFAISSGITSEECSLD